MGSPAPADAATEYVRGQGGRIVEAYPWDIAGLVVGEGAVTVDHEVSDRDRPARWLGWADCPGRIRGVVRSDHFVMGPTEIEPNPYSLRVPVECDTVGPLATARCVIQPGTLRG